MNLLLAIDPGPEQSAYLTYNADTGLPDSWGKVPNEDLLKRLDCYAVGCERLAIEMVASYGMAVGAEVFSTCVWAGRFIERWTLRSLDAPHREVFRREVKMHLCQSMRATDANIRAALIDRYGPGKDRAVGRKATPGPLYGISGDCWAALGVAVTVADTDRQAQVA